MQNEWMQSKKNSITPLFEMCGYNIICQAVIVLHLLLYSSKLHVIGDTIVLLSLHCSGWIITTKIHSATYASCETEGEVLWIHSDQDCTHKSILKQLCLFWYNKCRKNSKCFWYYPFSWGTDWEAVVQSVSMQWEVYFLEAIGTLVQGLWYRLETD